MKHLKESFWKKDIEGIQKRIIEIPDEIADSLMDIFDKYEFSYFDRSRDPKTRLVWDKYTHGVKIFDCNFPMSKMDFDNFDDIEINANIIKDIKEILPIISKRVGTPVKINIYADYCNICFDPKKVKPIKESREYTRSEPSKFKYGKYVREISETIGDICQDLTDQNWDDHQSNRFEIDVSGAGPLRTYEDYPRIWISIKRRSGFITSNVNDELARINNYMTSEGFELYGKYHMDGYQLSMIYRHRD